MKRKTGALAIQRITRSEPTLEWRSLPILGEARNRPRRMLLTRVVPLAIACWGGLGLVAWALLA